MNLFGLQSAFRGYRIAFNTASVCYFTGDFSALLFGSWVIIGNKSYYWKRINWSKFEFNFLPVGGSVFNSSTNSAHWYFSFYRVITNVPQKYKVTLWDYQDSSVSFKYFFTVMIFAGLVQIDNFRPSTEKSIIGKCCWTCCSFNNFMWSLVH